MGSSLVLQGGAAIAKTLKEAIAQTGHGFTVGDVIRWDQTLTTPKFVRAVADSAANAEVAGVVNEVTDANNFQVTYQGYIDLPNLLGVTAPVMFLSSVAGGSLASSPPSAIGTVVKPVLTRNNGSNGFLVMNYLGTQIGGSSTIAVDEIQPVGTIMPFAGTAIPDTWLACDGASYEMSAYPELYEKVCYTTGDRVPLYGHVVEINVSSGSVYASGTQNIDPNSVYGKTEVGDYIFIKNHTVTATATTPTTTPFQADTGLSSWDTMGIVVAKGLNSGGAIGYKVQIIPKWTETNTTSGTNITRRFIMPNVLVKSFGTGVASAFRVISGANAVTDRGAGSINTANVIAFNVPDLSGRFPVGVMDTLTDSAGAESDSPYIHITTQQGPIALGAMGGEDRHQLTTAEMPSHDHPTNATQTSGDYYWVSDQTVVQQGTAETVSAGQPNTWEFSRRGQIAAQGGNTPHNNMPPYLAVRYIIKAKPYTRAAIIDGIDLPYNSLLVRDLRTRTVGGSNSDLVFHTNIAGDGGNGSPAMWLTNSGKLGIGYDTDGLPTPGAADSYYGPKLHLFDRVLREPVTTGVSTAASTIISGGKSNFAIAGGEPVSGRYNMFFSLGRTAAYIGTNSNNRNISFVLPNSDSADLNSMAERLTITPSGNVGVGVAAPTARLDVNGTLRVGDFGGSTNVMAKATNANLTVGQVVPLLRGQQVAAASGTLAFNQTSICLPAGTWFVYMTASDNSIVSTSNVDEDVHFTMAKVWTVPTGQFLRFGCIAKAPTSTNTTLGYWMDSSSALKTSSDYTAFKEFATNASGDQTAWNAAAATPLQITSSGTGPSVIYGPSSADGSDGLLNYAGYAIRIA